jgi:uncharacterized protein YjbK
MTTEEPELEFKCSLTEEEYQRSLFFFNTSTIKAKTQTNHYFDDEVATLENKGATLRIRTKEGDNVIQMKIPIEGPDDKIELVQSIENTEFEGIKSGNEPFPWRYQIDLDLLGAGKPVFLGKMTTKRVAIEEESVNGEWAIDHSILPSGKSDYELELEYESDSKEVALNMFKKKLQDLSIEWVVPISKFERFISDLKKETP